ncbi:MULTISPECIES: YbaB/EbfC family nucleoid-associated protein [Kaistia]|uniref:Nucleoid-associated protein OSH07_01985 n=1 Tax=Kaistia nematophila TaxID=2994654 RepID=A0A9X3DXV0_9HYPH|nr:YbaB/EbfC family nucleoid-associated protein [Kaistia nematophila]MBN9027028.1 YbaB/EbfC family nucleoid-associated protein [Hyphomicrobiales bacterium]MCX5567956.1 YbaB/EbfC family nucleoid-associated protein [Kaistia nematophila]
MRDILGMMSKAKELQSKMQDMQAEVANIEVEGSSGAGLVKVVMTAKGDLRKLSIDPSLLKPEDVEILEDLITAAHADARAKAERTMAEKMEALTGGLGLPAGLKLPF